MSLTARGYVGVGAAHAAWGGGERGHGGATVGAEKRALGRQHRAPHAYVPHHPRGSSTALVQPSGAAHCLTFLLSPNLRAPVTLPPCAR